MSAALQGGCGAGRSTRLSRHADHRSRERSIPASVIDALLDFGDRARSGTGAETCYFTKRSWKKFATYLGREARHFERYRAAYAIVADDGEVITTCWRQ
ncbi:hypothetical protein [Blastomonas fulva]|uniref:hypothetical protein n=1 Tax=Blastomonas fulva TaxID=1550728 RepID=UPI003D2827D9